MIVVTGATGNVGRPLVQALAGAGEDVTAVSRHVPDDLPDGVRHRAADLADLETLRPALDGADALFLLIAGPLLGSPAGPGPRDVLDVVKASGVANVVLLSSQGAGTRPESPAHARQRAFEEAVRESGLDWTILRPGGFASNAYAWAEPVRAHRSAAAPFAGVALPFVDPADIAEVAAAVLREGGHAGRVYELTGPAPVTPRDRARIIGEALGEPVAFTEQTREEARARMLEFMPAPVVDGTLDILGEPTEAERRVSPDVQRVLGRPARSFAQWAAGAVAAFR
ncbi:NAD(P)H-binding protein [Actinomadura welshii]|uniref:NAD(P)H-binding protein n=1 Tax=Actinomadura welshii TaxID=3103817 RepID=UPI0003AD580B|nr:NAD(P)H-binding protein [Actinomadura madurae]